MIIGESYAGKEAIMKATELLKEDHEKVKNLINKLKSSQKNQEELLDLIDTEVKVHSQAEEQFFYPAMRKFDSGLVEDSLREHRKVDEILDELKATDVDEEDFEDLVADLEENLNHHIEEEEGNMFVQAEDNLKGELEGLGSQIAEFKKKELASRGKKAA
jgi:hemerythrin-like domain-containing protein